jgi:acetyl-CoA acetyltransferase
LSRRTLDRIRAAIRNAAYDVTAHAIEEIAEDALDIVDVETAILNGRLVKTQRDDPRGTRYTVHGIGADGITPVWTVGRFTGTGRHLIITAYEIMEPRV